MDLKKLGAAVVALILVNSGGAFADVILKGAGATFPYPLYKKWIEVHENETGVRVSYEAIGSGGGIQSLLKRDVDFGATDAYMTEGEMKTARKEIIHIPACVGAVSLVYNLPVNIVLRLTPDLVADIFLGKITNWGDERLREVNADVRLPSIDINVVHRSESSGTTFIFTDYLSRVSPQWKRSIGKGKKVEWPTGMGVERNWGVADFVNKIPGSIGYVERTFANNMNLPLAVLRNRSGRFLAPSLESVSAAAQVELPDDVKIMITDTPNADGYPICAFTYLIFFKEQAYGQRSEERARALARFFWWAIHEGQRFNEPLLYGRLPTQAVEKAELLIRSMTYRTKKLIP